MNKQTKQPAQSIVAYFAIFTAAVFIVSYGAVTSYFSGYLDYFGINIRYIDFWPHLPDFMLVAAPMIGFILFTGALSYLAFYVLNNLWRFISKFLKKSWGDIFSNKAALVGIFIALCLGTFNIVYVSKSEDGTELATNQTKFIRVGTDGDKIDLLIYQNGGIAFTKTYNKESKQFEPGYKSINFTGQSLQEIEILKN
jgi:hypothetical protein